MKISEYNQMMAYLTRPATPEQRKKYNVGNKVETKNTKKTEKKPVEKQTIKVAMSETPEEEAEMMLSGEAVEFMKWLKKNKDKTYNDWLKDKKAMLTPEQKKDPKIIELPLPFTFQEELERMLEEEEKNTEKDESYKRGFDEGIQSILRVRKV